MESLCRILVLISALLLANCGMLLCVDTEGELYNMQITLSSKGKNLLVKDAQLYALPHGYQFFKNIFFLGGQSSVSDSMGIVKFGEYSKNYSSCESAPEFSSLSPMTILVVHPDYDSILVVFDKNVLKNTAFQNGVYVLPNIELNPKNTESSIR